MNGSCGHKHNGCAQARRTRGWRTRKAHHTLHQRAEECLAVEGTLDDALGKEAIVKHEGAQTRKPSATLKKYLFVFATRPRLDRPIDLFVTRPSEALIRSTAAHITMGTGHAAGWGGCGAHDSSTQTSCSGPIVIRSVYCHSRLFSSSLLRASAVSCDNE